MISSNLNIVDGGNLAKSIRNYSLKNECDNKLDALAIILIVKKNEIKTFLF